jgi:hypothetical protein
MCLPIISIPSSAYFIIPLLNIIGASVVKAVPSLDLSSNQFLSLYHTGSNLCYQDR